MLQQLLQLVAQEDTFKLFTGEGYASIYDAMEEVRGSSDPVAIQNAVERFFGRILESNPPGSFCHNEAVRILRICQALCADEQARLAAQQEARPPLPRDQNDDIVDLYMDSLRFFAAALDEPILNEHIRFLDCQM